LDVRRVSTLMKHDYDAHRANEYRLNQVS